MNDSYSKWSDVRAKGRATDPRTPVEQVAGKELASGRARLRDGERSDRRTVNGHGNGGIRRGDRAAKDHGISKQATAKDRTHVASNRGCADARRVRGNKVRIERVVIRKGHGNLQKRKDAHKERPLR